MSKAGRWWRAEVHSFHPEGLTCNDPDAGKALAAAFWRQVQRDTDCVTMHLRRQFGPYAYHPASCPGCELPECEVGTNAHRARPRW